LGRGVMEEVILRVGLPVKCRLCDTKGRVIPRTDYGGWARRKTVVRTSWYCPDHAGAVERLADVPVGVIPKEKTQADDLTELMNMI